MEHQPTSIERAFQLAGLGCTVQEIRARLKAEHLSPQQIFGASLCRQLRDLGNAARG